MARLTVVSSPDARVVGKRVELGADQVSFGREPANVLAVDDPAVSRRHLRVEVTEGGHVLRDLGGANGTFVNGQRVSEHALRNGDRIRAGSTELVFEGQLGPAPVAGPAVGAPAWGAGGPPPIPVAPPPPPPPVVAAAVAAGPATPGRSPQPPPGPLHAPAPPHPGGVMSRPPAPGPPRPGMPAGLRWAVVGTTCALAVLGVVAGGAFLARQLLPRPPALEVGQDRVGPVLATGKVGPEGGRVEAAGVVALEIPPGALDRTERVVIRGVEGHALKGALFEFEISGDGLFKLPVRVVHQIPPEVDPSDVVAVHEIGLGWLGTVPSTVDGRARTVTAEVRHFSISGWFELASYRTWISLVGGSAASFVTGFILLKVGFATGVLPILLVVTAFAGGAAVSNPVWDAVEQMGYDSHFAVAGFNISWVTTELDDLPSMVVMVDEKGGMVTYDPVGGGAAWDPASVDWAAVEDKAEYMRTRRAYTVPEVVLQLAGVLQYVRVRYAAEGFKTPEATTVLITDDVGKSDWGSDQNFGKWDGANLRISWSTLDRLGRGRRVSAKEVSSLLGTVAHEYWHAIWAENGFSETLSGLDECMATSFESWVFPSLTEYSDLRKWSDAVPVLVNGLVQAGPGEGNARASLRGYNLWTWGKWLIHTQGASAITELALGEMPDDTRSALFAAFARALLVEELGLQPKEAVSLPDGTTLDATTGWGAVDLDAMADPSSGRLWKPGRNELPDPGPLSVSLVKVLLPAVKGRQSSFPLVVRREEPDVEEELIALRPVSGRIMVSRVPTLDDVTTGRGGVSVDASWLSTAGRNLALPVAVVARGSSYVPSSSDFLTYRLAPPGSVTAAREPQGSSVKLGWVSPRFDGGLEVQSCIAGYRVFGASRDGTEVVLAEALFDLAYWSTPKGWYSGGSWERLTIAPDDRAVTLPDEVVGGDVVRVGMASVDGQMKQGASQMLSAVAWSGPLEPGSEAPPLRGAFLLTLQGTAVPEDTECSPPGEGLTFGIGLRDVAVTLDENGRFELTHDERSAVGTPETKVRGRAGSGQLELSGSMTSAFEQGSPTVTHLDYRKTSTSCTFSGRSPITYSESWGLRAFKTTTPIVAECKGVSEVRAGATFDFGGGDGGQPQETEQKPAVDGPQHCRGSVKLTVTLTPR